MLNALMIVSSKHEFINITSWYEKCFLCYVWKLCHVIITMQGIMDVEDILHLMVNIKV